MGDYEYNDSEAAVEREMKMEAERSSWREPLGEFFFFFLTRGKPEDGKLHVCSN